MAAQLHGAAFHVLASHGGQLLAHRCGPCERHLADHRVRNQVAGDFGRITIDQADHTCGHTGIHKTLEQRSGRGRRFLGGLAQKGATRGQRRTDLAHDLVDREVPGREGGHRPHGLLDHQLLHIATARRHDAAVQTQRLVGKPFDDADTSQHFHFGFRQRLALLLRQQCSDVIRTLFEQGRSLAHGGLALMRAGVFPDREALFSGCQRTVQIFLACMCQLPNHLTCGRVVHRHGFAAGSRLPLTVDE